MKMFTKDILGYIFEFLDPKYLSDISLVCITWNYVLTEAFWSRQIIKYRGIGPDDYKKYFNNDKNYTLDTKKAFLYILTHLLKRKKTCYLFMRKNGQDLHLFLEKNWLTVNTKVENG